MSALLHGQLAAKLAADKAAAAAARSQQQQRLLEAAGAGGVDSDWGSGAEEMM